MNNKNVSTYLIGVLLLASCGHDTTADMDPKFTTESEVIVQEFLDDEKSASAKYIDQVVQISGPVFEINKVEGEISGVKISSDEFAIVNCTFQEIPELMPEGDITIKGICSGFMGDSESMLPGGTVEMNRAVIVQ
tara:strand:+ start:6784 stop:7188 length:405 start_codon:yes stop_codon:yes gene_type:complete